MTKKITAIILATLLFVSTFAGCSLVGKQIQIGTSDVYITIPAGYEKGAMSIEDTDEGQVAYYKGAADQMDFDLYYWAKATGETLDSAVDEETDNEIKSGTFGGLDTRYYEDIEDSLDGTFPTVTYIMDDGDYFVEIVFWIDGDDAQAQIDKIMKSVKVKENKGKTGENLVRLGTSDLYITTHKAYEKGEMNREDTDLCQVAYYASDDSLVDFDVYYWAKGDGETLDSTAALEAEEFGAEIFDREINGIKTKFYTAAAEESADGTFPTITYIIDDGDYLAEIVFWLDGDNPDDEVETIIATLTK